MKKFEYAIIVLTTFSFLLSVTLWFTGLRDEGLYVGIWVPSILSAATFFKNLSK